MCTRYIRPLHEIYGYDRRRQPRWLHALQKLGKTPDALLRHDDRTRASLLVDEFLDELSRFLDTGGATSELILCMRQKPFYSSLPRVGNAICQSADAANVDVSVSNTSFHFMMKFFILT